MIIASKKDEDAVIEILVDSFENIHIDNSINFIVGKETGKQRCYKLRRLFEYQFRMALMFGKVFLSEDLSSTILFIHKKKDNFRSLMLELKLVIQVIGLEKILKILKREKLLKRSHNTKDYIHLWLMATKTAYQGKGIGKHLLAEAINYYSGKTVILETTTIGNVSFYQKLGFRVFEENYSLGFPLFFMKNV
ncbi:GNAT family N-acetyltransferase [Elizabethkingia argentiflava]|uniref:GNAT family N-acetyltransferase n=1 Tax=Elizabethkingia argenteiflava TaxID=2681556 RepID=A0A845PX50_9FLAO|nr:GNAT family N-acetyltransferase [Elizabethkingia argenteiflava]NAW50898.1 GNAT family N-acetyltransferase [Elizabethkingia argenteiflava]